MNDLPDYELHQAPSESPRPTPSPTRPVGLWVAVALLIAAGGGAAYIAFGWRPQPAPTPTVTPSPKATVAEPPLSLGGRGEPVAIPPLDASDALVRTLVRALFANPAVTEWLTTNDLVRNFTVVVANVAEGPTPARHLKVLRPSAAFRVVERDGGPYLDPRGYDRYAVIADAVASVDPAGPPSFTRPSSHVLRRCIANWDLLTAHSTERSNERSLQSSTRPAWTAQYGLSQKGSATRMPMNDSKA